MMTSKNKIEDTLGVRTVTAHETQSAMLNILEDFETEKLRLENTQSAVLNILEDLSEANTELKKSRDMLEIRVEKRTAELKLSNEQLQKEMEERKKVEEALQLRTEELARSNADLEQFAYVASHDLQEPLRMVTSYMQLLSRRYTGKIDADADEFINFAVDGAKRMQILINDLLAYSRIGTRGRKFGPVLCDEILDLALANLLTIIEETEAVVTHDTLPTVLADKTQLVQLLQNLISNAIKFRSDKKPHIHVSAENKENKWIFSVKDNGIGIDPRYGERIFEVFQRLHGRGHYSGTGIGLAICKKIVERHGGWIRVQSEEGEGATFYFSLPVIQHISV